MHPKHLSANAVIDREQENHARDTAQHRGSADVEQVHSEWIGLGECLQENATCLKEGGNEQQKQDQSCRARDGIKCCHVG